MSARANMTSRKVLKKVVKSDPSTGADEEAKPVSKEIVAILLGESGVGKSTFINALANYYKSVNFETAEQTDLECLIPAHFTLTDENFQQVVIQLGSDANERKDVGKAATQNAKSHLIRVSDEVNLRLIDTPGIGDADGFLRDQANIKNTMKYISQFKNLHGICVLMKPNNARLDLHFRYCFKELLVNLHKNAAPNIVFCFTNTRNTFYKPGDSMPPLTQLIKDISADSKISIPLGRDNVFCFDNESFRFLAAQKQDFPFAEGERKDFTKSWDVSTKSAQDMFNYISGLDIHLVEDTVNLNRVREVLFKLARPIAVASQNIQTNLKILAEKMDDLDALDANKFNFADLNDKLTVTTVMLKRKQLDHPRTVCTHADCTEIVEVGEIAEVNYISHCHPDCSLDGIVEEAIGAEDLKSCYCMTNGKCDKCTHGYKVHMHISYEYESEQEQLIDNNVQDMIDQRKNKKDIIKATIATLDANRKEFEDEQEKIIEISAKFATFLKQNAIAVFNDDLDAYLELSIREEQSKATAGAGNQVVLDGLKEVRDNYQQQKKLLANVNSSQAPLTYSEIDDLVQRITELPITGDNYREIIESI